MSTIRLPKFALFRGVIPGVNEGQKFFSTNHPEKDQTKLLDGTVAYEIDVIETVTEKDQTEEGILLKDLGLGLGPTTNGRPCDACCGKGYTSYSCEKDVCPDCRRVYDMHIFSFFFDPEGVFEYRCRKCKGTGSFTKNGKVVGTCFNCNGKGWHKVNRRARNSCQTCKGRMEIDNPKGAKKHLRCTTCKGTGEILVFNPVLPKGLLAGRL